MPVRVAINGFGRTGRATFRAAHEQGADIEWVAINDVMGAASVAQLLANDSVYGRFPGTVEALDGAIRVDGVEIPVFAEPIRALPWQRARCRGRDRVQRALPRACRRRPPPGGRRAQGDHLRPRQGADVTVALGVNFDESTTRSATTSSRTRRARRTASPRWRRCCTRRSASATGS